MSESGAPPVWNSYVFVDDADAVAAAAEAAGGTVVMPAMDVMESGRMVMVAAPDGAVIGAWQPLEHQGAEAFDRPGAVTWNELQSRDLAAARDFLSEVFGWGWDRQPGEMEYWVAHVGSSADDTASEGGTHDEVGGAMNMPDGVPLSAPSMWVVYFGVDDCDLSAAHVTELGGSLFLPPMEMGPGRFAGASDPAGAMFFFGSFPDPA
jgi:predicted enzyme related to lactoylglutathione lyase